jgi:hypothetical protein
VAAAALIEIPPVFANPLNLPIGLQLYKVNLIAPRTVASQPSLLDEVK